MFKLKLSVASLLCAAALVPCAARTLAQDKTLTERPIADAPSLSKRALVIGVGEYEHAGSLAPTTYNDARRFADLLRSQFKFPDVAITLLTDAPGTAESSRPTYIHLRNALKTLLADINEKSEVIVYFSGHGIRAEDHDWLVPQDGVPGDVTSTCINYDDFKSQLNTHLPARALLIVDACRNLSSGKDAGSSGFAAGKDLSGPQFAELLSCRPKEESKVGKPADFAESVFTHYLLQGLEGDPEALSGGVVTFDSLKEFVEGRVSQYVSSKYGESQNPDGRASLGKMVLARAAAIAAAPKSDPGSIAQQNPERPLSPDGHGAGGQAANTKINPKDGAVMIFIPAGPFLMGDDDVKHNPRHTTTLSGNWIYRDLVTDGMYKKYCQDAGKQMPRVPNFNPDWSKEDHPIVVVSWNDAVAYCTWAGVTLPSEAQWEKAARGTDGRKYPWGNEFDMNKVWASKAAVNDAGGTAVVGRHGVSVYGCTDMAGNVWQWCADWYDANLWSGRATEMADPVNRSAGTEGMRVLRGGSWREINAGYFRASYRSSSVPVNGYYNFGFRCASGQ